MTHSEDFADQVAQLHACIALRQADKGSSVETDRLTQLEGAGAG